MSRILVTLRVAIDNNWGWGTSLQVYTNQGSGDIDYDSPLLPRRFEVFPDTPEPLGYGEDPYGETPYGGAMELPENAGYGFGPYGEEPDGYGADDAFVEIPIYVAQGAGIYAFGVKAFDAGGNAQAGAADEQNVYVCGTQPRPVRNFAYAQWLIGPSGGQASFSFNL